MNINEVPQDPLNYKDRDQLKKLVYAVDKNGKYTGVNSAGWEAENAATQLAWNEAEQNLGDAEAKVKAGELSPIAYFMQKSRMDLSLLAKYAGKWEWQVKKHLKPEGFNKLSPAMLAKYAQIFHISLDELVAFGKSSS